MALGSSGTYGFKIEPEDTWPMQLEVVLREEGIRAKVWNMASPGLPIAAFAERILLIEKSIAPDLYLLQMPPFSRIYFGVNGSGKIKEEKYAAAKIMGWKAMDDNQLRLSPTRIHLDRLVAVADTQFHYILKRYFYPKIARNNPTTTYEELEQFAKFWGENIAYSDLSHIQHAKEVVLLQLLIGTRLQRPYWMFDWNEYNVLEDQRIGPFREQIEFQHFIKQGRQSALKFLEAEQGEQYSQFKVDAYGHLNRAGNRYIAQNFIRPALNAILKNDSV